MMDIHSHILFGIDDGPSAMEESLKMICEAEKAGVKVIVATPHFRKDLFEIEKAVEKYNQLLEKTTDYGVTVLMGYEVSIDPFIPKMLKDGNDLLLNNSNYILLEIPFDSIPIYISEVIYELQLIGIIPIIAHPERNRVFLDNFGKLIRFAERGCLLQIDAASIVGVYGRKIKNFSRKIIKLNLAHYAASDAHCASDYTNLYLKAYKKVVRWAGEDYADKLFYSNAKAILDRRQKSLRPDKLQNEGQEKATGS